MQVIVGIPVYKETINKFEEVSLRQADKVLSRYRKVFIAPESLEFDYGKSYEVIRFPDVFFKDKDSYSELLLNFDFYNRLREYNYLLIYQLDAFVFDDNLEDFCSMDVDYIGAPQKGGDWTSFHVGNGGLSLRNINKCKRLLSEKEEIKNRIYNYIESDKIAEDVFWGYCGWDDTLDFKVLTPRKAARFSVMNDSYHGLRRIAIEGLPFGCHYWYIQNYEFWRPFIESYGYELETRNDTVEGMENQCKKLNMHLLLRYIRHQRISLNDNIFDVLKKDVYIWGAGKYGCRCIIFLQELGKVANVNVKGIFDNTTDGKVKYGFLIRKLDLNRMTPKNMYIIISSIKYEYEMKEKLREAGWKNRKNYCTMFELIEEILKSNNRYWVDTKTGKLKKPIN